MNERRKIAEFSPKCQMNHKIDLRRISAINRHICPRCLLIYHSLNKSCFKFRGKPMHILIECATFYLRPFQTNKSKPIFFCLKPIKKYSNWHSSNICKALKPFNRLPIRIGEKKHVVCLVWFEGFIVDFRLFTLWRERKQPIGNIRIDWPNRKIFEIGI